MLVLFLIAGFAAIGSTGLAQDIPRPAPLATLAEAQAAFPGLREPAWHPPGFIGPAVVIRREGGAPIIDLSYSHPAGGLEGSWFRWEVAPASLAPALAPRALVRLPERHAYGRVGEGPPPTEADEVQRILPRREIHRGIPVGIVSAPVCADAFCERRTRYVAATACDPRVCIRIEGDLREETALEILLSAFGEGR
ncbi:hypothetical protein [Thermoflexus sp.]|uniref:hypothetical protein n=1 Tax=Thermoflexus sp. TaxID=1969742 RepID=UPI002ADD7A9B|nr:hypothetical protein [Thermoflexus sp.]